ncbi:hypothetical protein JRQ81_016604 [Phrynocephalus forsythii]|uniref:Borealin N-terminal domain-containing protein n=1 Tax=Phrynocephalus forsythii TaxID=171643 RepID=A0A9Q0XSK3_9SAUR|nr:hypothetical protein JRQ81_016604 [Phrynocephalus forsythii]
MALRKHLEEAKKHGSDSRVEPDCSLLDKEQRDQRIGLLLQDFDHHVKENLQEMKKELVPLLQMAEQVFQVESLAVLVAMRTMRRKDLIGLKEDVAATLAASLEANNYCVRHKPTPKLVRMNSKRVKVTTIVEYKDDKEEDQGQGKKTSHKVFKANSL